MYLLVPAILFFLPADYFDSGQAMCLSVILADMECYACGMTRACMHLIHFDFTQAIYYNALSVVVFPILALVWATWFVRDWKTLQALRRAPGEAS